MQDSLNRQLYNLRTRSNTLKVKQRWTEIESGLPFNQIEDHQVIYILKKVYE